MFKERYRVRQLEYCNKQMFGNLIVTCPSYATTMNLPKKIIQPVPITVKPVVSPNEIVRNHLMEAEKRRTSLLVDQLLLDIHNSIQHSTDYNSTTSGKSSQKYCHVPSHDLNKRDKEDLSELVGLLGGQIERVGVKLVRRLKRREVLRRQQEAQCDVITCQLMKLLPASTEDMCFTVNPQSGESGFSQWVSAMKMVAQLPGGIPPEFRKRLWLTMAEKHLTSKGVDWARVERTCFSEWSHPEDGELGVQIVKDLHRTGCSLFCGEGGQENQALLKKVLLAYARWNKAVGYCQGFNMLAALILQVTDRSETDALKLMIYLIEGVLPDSYFADSLRGLSVDMAVFRELLRTRLPRLSKHLDLLQNMSKEGTTSYEPPLTNVFTMQWFLTLFCNCLPQPSVLRVWDLILLEGNEILLRTALAIWQSLSDRILRVKTADEFYCIMGLLMNELLENNLIDANSLIKAVVAIGPMTELQSLRDHYLYNINPWGTIPSSLFSEKQLKLYPRERLALDISALKKQYMKLRQRQRQAHIIFSAAINRQPPPRAPVAMNHLLLGKSALVPAKRLGPPKGSIPPARIPLTSTLHWKDTARESSSSSSSDTELCDDDNPDSDSSDDLVQKSSCELPEDSPSVIETTNVMRRDRDEDITDSVQLDTNRIGNNDLVGTVVDTFDVKKVLDVDSEDDSVDFELFLEDRVKCLKDSVSPTKEEKRVSLSRRNSERALQIIQENSLILHRILQCQSRLSLSPPPAEVNADTDDDLISKPSLESFRYAGDGMFSPSCSSSELTVCLTKDTSGNDTVDESLASTNSPPPENCACTNAGNSELPTADYPSKYDAIFERSKTLNEKYDSLIVQTATDLERYQSQTENMKGTPENQLITFASNNESEESGLGQQNWAKIHNNFNYALADNETPQSSEELNQFESAKQESSSQSTMHRDEYHSNTGIVESINSKEDNADILGNSLCELSNSLADCYIDNQKLKSNDYDSQNKQQLPPNIEDNLCTLDSTHYLENQDHEHNHICINSNPSYRKNVDDLEISNEHYSSNEIFAIPSISRLSFLSETNSSSNPNISASDSKSVLSQEITLSSATSGYVSKSETIMRSFCKDENIHSENSSPITCNKKFHENNEEKCQSKNVLSERTPSPYSQCSDDISDCKEDLLKRLKKTIKSPKIPREGSDIFSSDSLFRISKSKSRDLKLSLTNSASSENLTVSDSVSISSPGEDILTSGRLSPRNKYSNSRDELCRDNVFLISNSSFENLNRSTTIEERGVEGFEKSTSSEESKNYSDSWRFLPTSMNRVASPLGRTDCRNISPISRDSKSPSNSYPETYFKDRTLEYLRSKSPIDMENIYSTDYMTNMSSVEPGSKLMSRVSNKGKERKSPQIENNEYSNSYVRKISSPEMNYDISRKSSPSFRDETSPKSPSKIFNPFPVPLSSRQNKEVGVKLGLYKK